MKTKSLMCEFTVILKGFGDTVEECWEDAANIFFDNFEEYEYSEVKSYENEEGL
jgi:hypothetical protein